MMKIGAFRAWMKRKIEHYKNVTVNQHFRWGYQQAMQDVAEYFDFPLDNKLWEKWQP